MHVAIIPLLCWWLYFVVGTYRQAKTNLLVAQNVSQRFTDGFRPGNLNIIGGYGKPFRHDFYTKGVIQPPGGLTEE